MSKLLEAIRGVGRRGAGSIGFGAALEDAGRHRQLLLIATVTDAAGAAAAVEAGASALLFSGNEDAAAPVVAAGGDVPTGAALTGATTEQVATLAEAGVDFLVFDDATTAAATLLDDRLGYVLTPGEEAWGERDYLEALQPLAVDAMLLGEHAAPVTVRDQLLTRRIATLSRKPLIVPTAEQRSAVTLEVWRDCGAVAVLATGAAAEPAGLLALAAALDELPPPRERGRERRSALVPALSGDLADEDDEF